MDIASLVRQHRERSSLYGAFLCFTGLSSFLAHTTSSTFPGGRRHFMSDTRDTTPSAASPNSSSAAQRAASLVEAHQGEILDLWIEAALHHLPGAQQKGRAELADHFTELLDEVICALRFADPLATPDQVNDLQRADSASSLHGRERAMLKGYTTDQLTHEYILLRRTLVHFCSQHSLAGPEVLEIMTQVIELATLNSVREFSRSMTEVQRKLMATLVHDVRTPLSVAFTYAEVLSFANASEEKRKAALGTITRSLRRATTMLEDLLDAARMEAGQGLFMRFCESDINETIRTICTEARQIYSSPIIPAYENHPVMGVFDLGLVARTVENLISNAVKFGYKDTPVKIEIKDQGESVSVCVHNQGDVIPKTDSASIFEFFSRQGGRSFHSGKGWGLGLSLIKTVAKCHGGEVIFKSSKENGTVFGMTLKKHFRQDGEELSTLL